MQPVPLMRPAGTSQDDELLLALHNRVGKI